MMPKNTALAQVPRLTSPAAPYASGMAAQHCY